MFLSFRNISMLIPCGQVTPYGDLRSGSTLARVKVCCLREAGSSLNQWWLAISFQIQISGIQWYSPEGNLTYYSVCEFEKVTFHFLPIIFHKTIMALLRSSIKFMLHFHEIFHMHVRVLLYHEGVMAWKLFHVNSSVRGSSVTTGFPSQRTDCL